MNNINSESITPNSVVLFWLVPCAELHKGIPHMQRYPNPSLSFWHTLCTSGSLKSISFEHVLIIIGLSSTKVKNISSCICMSGILYVHMCYLKAINNQIPRSMQMQLS